MATRRLFLGGITAGLTGALAADGAEPQAPPPSAVRSIRDFDVTPANPPAKNKANLQAAIDWAAERGAALFVEPTDEPYPIDGGLVLRMNAALIGVHGPVGRGTRHPTKRQPVGSVFAIRDTSSPWISVETATRLSGLQFWYPDQTLRDPGKLVQYPATVRVAQNHNAHGVTLSRLTFFGEYDAFDFVPGPRGFCEQILFEHCYGYPLSGRFIRIERCYDIPRILHCHVNPSNRRFIDGGYSVPVVDSVVARKTFTYDIDRTDNAQIIDAFTFGVYGGIRLGPASYGQLTNFNLDCVTVGIHKLGDSPFNRNWQLAQGSIIANTGEKLQDVHPFIIEGHGHTAISNVEAFSGGNGALTTLKQSQDFMLVRGDKTLTVSLFGCRMRNYAADEPITINNPRAAVQAVACVDKAERLYNRTIEPSL
jgi:hypothetical protein